MELCCCAAKDGTTPFALRGRGPQGRDVGGFSSMCPLGHTVPLCFQGPQGAAAAPAQPRGCSFPAILVGLPQ